MENIVIGIEGLVGAGKTTMCRELLKIIPNSIVFHGGNLYRGIVYALLQSNKELEQNINNLKSNFESIDIKKIMDMLKIEIRIENRETVIYAQGKKIDEEKLQSKEISMAVSIAGGSADNTNLFIFLRNLINEFKQKYNVILSGRAINTIYPNVDYHFLITASLDERVKRKAIQYGDDIDLKELRQHIKTRDELQEKAGFYEVSKNTIILDVTECKSGKESAEELYKHIGKIECLN